MRNKNLLALIILLSTLKVSASDSNVDFNKDWKFVLKDSAHSFVFIKLKCILMYIKNKAIICFR